MCTAAPKKAPHPQLSTHFTIVVQPKSVQIVVNDPFQWVGGGLLRYLGRPAAGRRSASRAPKRRLWCYIRTQHARRNTFQRVLVSNSWNGTQNYWKYTSEPCAENQYIAFFNKTLPKSFQYSYQIGLIHIEKISTIFSIRKKEVWCQRKTMWISIWRTQAVLCEACAGYVAAGGLYRKPSAVKTKNYKGKNLSTAQMRDVTWGKTQLKNNRNCKSSFYTCNKWVFSCK